MLLFYTFNLFQNEETGDKGNTEPLQESNTDDLIEENFVQEMRVEDGSVESVDMICGKYEEVVQTDQSNDNEEINECEADGLVPEDDYVESVETNTEDNEVDNKEEIALEDNEVSCLMQLEKVSDTMYILKPIDVKDQEEQEEQEEEIDEATLELQQWHKCPGCIRVFSATDALDRHWQSCQGEQVVDSEETKLNVETVQDAPKQKRARWGEGRSYPCTTCGKVFKVPAMLRTHERVHTGERPFLCSFCTRSFTQLYALRNHEQQHRGEYPYPCKECGKGFFRPSDLEKHVRSHTGERPYMCSKCSKAFHQLSGLVVHERIHTGERPYSCSFCSMTFNQWANKKRHERTHAGGMKPYTCDLCHRKFSDRKEMELHRAGHGGGRPRTCPHCCKSFRKPSELRDHLRRMHTNERPYQCEVCSKAFFVAHELRQHVMVHTGERPFSCVYCSQTFRQKGNLKRHQESHHKEFLKDSVNVILEEVNVDDIQLTQDMEGT
ncbi:hypothetical protein C0J52_13129 [Blattella germanica]|nr:hypothetical protein C0J52_13129 [Blattella germanica]